MSFADYFDCGCCNPYKIAKRFSKLLLSLWMIGDMIMDAITNMKYYNIAQVNQQKIYENVHKVACFMNLG